MSDEDILPDDYPIYCGYWYVVDGEPICSPIEGKVPDLRRATSGCEIRRCNAVERRLHLS